ncbi:discoidin domain-containing protein [Paenibacillus sp. sptzw28]|uniref:polysaccharide lyase family 8 super-sandwich domain-containing protein n=1 Tax=Paenibacillus sp. sptzw28 TaxID=715179 RepID=UPI001C6E454A|nr:polysaccharide lyase family 8 super-sandwich domain-containing protein [Paenibacillus sp. sptzw28]QYR20590.1 discoidin domain-containing protein [Paenibacillus sp. sptzw28]
MTLISQLGKVFMVAALLIFLIQFYSASAAHAADEYDVLRGRWKTLLGGGKDYSVNDPDIVARIASITTEAQTYWNSMNKAAGRTYLWSDLASTSDSSHITGSYNRLRSMVLAYSTFGSQLHDDAALQADIAGALDWMYTNRYNTSKTVSGNWWDWEIGAPLALNDIMVMFYEQLSPTQITNYTSAIDKFQSTITQTGANRVWESMIIAVRGIVGKNSAKIAAGRDGLSPVFDVVTAGDGFYPDGSFIQHTVYPYTGGYGKELLSDISRMMYVLDQSTWAITDPDKQNVFGWIYNSFEPLVYRGAMMDMVRGRDMSRMNSDHYVGQSVIRSVTLLSQVASPSDAARYKSMVKYWIQTNTYENFYATAPINMIVLAKNIINDASIPSRGELVKQVQYSSMDRAVQLQPGYGFGISMSSKRIANYESINNENYKAWYTADGMTYLYNSDLSQFSDGFWPTINPYRMPGTTVDTQTRADGSGKQYISPSSWAGGTSILGTYGISGMDLDAWGSSLTAKKSWFMFDDEIIALGAGITSSDSRKIETVIENRKLNGPGNNALTVNGTAKPASTGWSETMTDVNWAHLAGTVPGSDIGYYFPEGASVKGLREARTGSWKGINIGGSTTPITRNYLNLWFDHGVNPSGATYAYVLLPNRSAAETSDYASAPEFTILENSADAQAVRENTIGVTGVNFWKDMVKTAGDITSDKKASVMTAVTAGVLEVSVSDPTQLNTGTINIEINKSAAGLAAADSRITVTQLSPTIKMTVNVSGTRGAGLKATFSLNEPVPANLALQKAVTASSTFSNKDWNILHAVDGGRSSVDGKKGWTSNNSLTTNHSEWFQVDLGSVMPVSKVDLYPRNDGITTGQGFPVDFMIMVSDNGSVWNAVVTQTGYPLPGNEVQSFSFSPMQVRYVRISGTNLSPNPYDHQYYRMQFAEVEVY